PGRSAVVGCLIGDSVGDPAMPVPQIAPGRSSRRLDDGAYCPRPARFPLANEIPPAVLPVPRFQYARWNWDWDFLPKLSPHPFRTIFPIQNLHFAMRA